MRTFGNAAIVLGVLRLAAWAEADVGQTFTGSGKVKPEQRACERERERM